MMFRLSSLIVLVVCASPLTYASPVNEIAVTVPESATVNDRRTEAHQTNSVVFGGPGGKAWSDEYMIREGKHHRIIAIKMWCGERLDGIQFGYADMHPPPGTPVTTKWGVVRGTASGFEGLVNLAFGRDNPISEISYITRQVRFNAFGKHTQVGYLEIKDKSSKNARTTCGQKAAGEIPTKLRMDSDKTVLYMSGRCGAGVDNLQAHFIPLADYAA